MYKGPFKLCIEIFGSIAVNGCQIKLFKKDEIVPEDDMLRKCSKSASSTFLLNVYIQFTLSAGTYSIDDFKTKVKESVFMGKTRLEISSNEKLKAYHTRKLCVYCQQ